MNGPDACLTRCTFVTLGAVFIFCSLNRAGRVCGRQQKKKVKIKKTLDTRRCSVRVRLGTRGAWPYTHATRHTEKMQRLIIMRTEKTLNTCVRLCNCNKSRHSLPFSPTILAFTFRICSDPLPFSHSPRVKCIFLDN